MAACTRDNEIIAYAIKKRREKRKEKPPKTLKGTPMDAKDSCYGSLVPGDASSTGNT
jgi:hypothetical protein